MTPNSLLQRLQGAVRRLQSGDAAGALAECQAILAQLPGEVDAFAVFWTAAAGKFWRNCRGRSKACI